MAHVDIPWESFSQRKVLRPPKGKLPGFVHITPNYEKINAYLKTVNHRARRINVPQINTIHVGETGTGKSTLIGALQELALQTCHPHHGIGSAPNQTKLYTTRIGRSLDTQGLNEGCVEGQTDAATINDAKQIRRNVEVLLESEINYCHAMFTDLDVGRRANASLIKSIRHAIEITNNRILNNVVVVERLDDGKCEVIFAAFDRIESSLKDYLRPEIIIIDPVLRNIGTPEPQDYLCVGTKSSDGFNYNRDREAVILFIRSAISRFVDNPIRVVKRNQYCNRGCGNVGDSRCFTEKCHDEPQPCHPPGGMVEAYTIGVDHPEPKRKHTPCHRNLVSENAPEFRKGGYAALEATFYGGDLVQPTVDGAVKFANRVVAAESLEGYLLGPKLDTQKGKSPLVSPLNLALGISLAGTVAEITNSALGIRGFGRWSCCNATSLDAPGCVEQWECCGAWQSTRAGAAKVGCRRKVCRGCKGDWEAPPKEVEGLLGEVKCSGCKAYVGAVLARVWRWRAEVHVGHLNLPKPTA